MSISHTRRRVLAAVPLMGTFGLLRPASVLAAEEQLETTRVRLGNQSGLCVAPIYVLEQLLRAEGFTDIQYVQLPPNQSAPDGIARGDIDFGGNFAPVLVSALDRGLPVTALGPLHLGCFEVFGGESVRTVADLRGKRVTINTFGSPWHLFLSVIGLFEARLID